MLDPVRARTEADAAERRGAGTLWAAGPVAWDAVSAGTVSQPEVVPVVEDAGEVPRALAHVAALPRATAVSPIPQTRLISASSRSLPLL